VKRTAIIRAIVTSAIAGVVVLCLPLLRHAYDVATVNIVVYVDRKRYEVDRCREFMSFWGFIGFALMLVLDILQAWLSITVLLSWVVRRNKYFFPTPNLPVKPGQFMGPEVAQSSLGNYGINIGPMLITWLMRDVHRRVETWTGKALVEAQKAQRRAARDTETPEERSARKAARKEAKREARRREEAAAAVSAPPRRPSAPAPSMPPDWMEPTGDRSDAAPPGPASASHFAFVQEVDEHNTNNNNNNNNNNSVNSDDLEYLQDDDNDDDDEVVDCDEHVPSSLDELD